MEAVISSLEGQGIVFRLGCVVASVERTEGGVKVTMNNGEDLAAEQVVVAAGRTGVVDGVGLDSVGVSAGRFVSVNDHLQVEGVDGGWLYAVGDVNGRALLTHQGKYQARQAGDHILGKEASAWADNNAVPAVVFTDPQVGSVGLDGAGGPQQRLERSRRGDGLGDRGRAAAGRGLQGRSEVCSRRRPSGVGRGDVRGAGGG